MTKKRIFWIVAVGILIVLLIAFFPQKNPDGHQSSDAKGKGDSRYLKDNVAIALVFADEPDSKWSETDKRNYLFKQMSEASSLKAEAEKYGTALDLSLISFSCEASTKFSPTDYSLWLNEALASAGLSADTAVDYLKTKYEKDEAAVVFVIKGSGASFSLPSTEKSGFECSFVYSSEAGFRHELLHLFGAKDLHSPEAVKTVAEEVFPESVMLSPENKTVDNLTAYLIGWTDTLDEASSAFIQRTKKDFT